MTSMSVKPRSPPLADFFAASTLASSAVHDHPSNALEIDEISLLERSAKRESGGLIKVGSCGSICGKAMTEAMCSTHRNRRKEMPAIPQANPQTSGELVQGAGTTAADRRDGHRRHRRRHLGRGP